MSIRTMGSQGGALQGPKSQSLTRQGSLYSLTLDEVQNQLGDLGKPLGSMNLDELLKSVWSAELNQAVDNVGNVQQQQQHQSAVPLQSQSSLNLSGDLSKKTVEEVWRDIQYKKGSNQEKTTQDRQITFGEMTLEDFLVKAGVVAEGESSSAEQNPGPVLGANPLPAPQHSQWMQYQLPAVQQQHQHQPNMVPVFMPGHPVQQPLPMTSTQVLDVAYPETQMTMSPSGLVSTLSDTQTPGRKRVAPGDLVEKTVERRQKRMIKNRESAARSRARKQVRLVCLSEPVPTAIALCLWI